MNRRNFLKSTLAVIAASAFMPKLPTVEAGPTVAKSGGVTDAQLRELIEATLRDLPKIEYKHYEEWEFMRIYNRS